MKIRDMSIATGRIFVCIGEAKGPLSMPDLAAAYLQRYGRPLAEVHLKRSVADLTKEGGIDTELRFTQDGAQGFAELTDAVAKEEPWAKRFYAVPPKLQPAPATKSTPVPSHQSVPGILRVH